MAPLAARLVTDRVLRWVSEPYDARVLHLFERSANLVNASGGVISIVNPEVGPGPFNLVLSQPLDMQRIVSIDDAITAAPGELQAGRLAIRLADAEVWDPVPPWRSIASSLAGLIGMIRSEMAVSEVQPAIGFDPPPDPDDPPGLESYTSRLAGLGPGLTPSGDDVLMGLMHAWFSRYPAGRAQTASEIVADAAVPRTTSLSAAWLRAAAAGEAGVLWHRLIAATAAGDERELRETIRRILATGHTSGADALAGFVAGLL